VEGQRKPSNINEVLTYGRSGGGRIGEEKRGFPFGAFFYCC